jgi:hypothetical protein
MALPLVLIALSLAHPVWSPGTSVFEGIAAASERWLVVHALLTVGFPALAVVLYRLLPNDGWRGLPAARMVLALFAITAGGFLIVDGVITGALVQSAVGQDAAQQGAVAETVAALWSGPLALVLANLSGFALALALFATGLALYPAARERRILIGLAIVSAALLGGGLGSVFGFPWPPAVARLAATVTGAIAVYQQGGALVPFALLVLAGVLPQHVGVEAQTGMACVFLAFAGRTFVWRPGRQKPPVRRARRGRTGGPD